MQRKPSTKAFHKPKLFNASMELVLIQLKHEQKKGKGVISVCPTTLGTFPADHEQ